MFIVPLTAWITAMVLLAAAEVIDVVMLFLLVRSLRMRWTSYWLDRLDQAGRGLVEPVLGGVKTIASLMANRPLSARAITLLCALLLLAARALLSAAARGLAH